MSIWCVLVLPLTQKQQPVSLLRARHAANVAKQNARKNFPRRNGRNLLERAFVARSANENSASPNQNVVTADKQREKRIFPTRNGRNQPENNRAASAIRNNARTCPNAAQDARLERNRRHSPNINGATATRCLSKSVLEPSYSFLSSHEHNH